LIEIDGGIGLRPGGHDVELAVEFLPPIDANHATAAVRRRET